MKGMEEDGELEDISSSIKVIRLEVKLGSNIGSLPKGCISLSKCG